MNKQLTGSDNKPGLKISFVEFWQFVADKLGDSRLTINPVAQSINEFVFGTTDHKDFLREVIIRSYKLSKCSHLQSAINLVSVLDVLGETAYELQGTHRDDLMDIELLEEIAWHISEHYSNYLPAFNKAPAGSKGELIFLRPRTH